MAVPLVRLFAECRSLLIYPYTHLKLGVTTLLSVFNAAGWGQRTRLGLPGP